LKGFSSGITPMGIDDLVEQVITMKSMSLKRVLDIANRAYVKAGGLYLPLSKEQAEKHTIGDTLADFIVIEIHETYDKEDKGFSMLTALRRAEDQIRAIADAIEDAIE